MSGSFALAVTKQVTANVVAGRTQGYRLKLSVAPTSGFQDGGVFMMLTLDSQNAELQGICGPADLNDLALNTPDGEGFFRTTTLDLTFASQSEALGVLTDIETQLKTLCDEMAKLQTDLTTPTIDTIESDD